MFHNFEGNSADEVWLKIANAFVRSDLAHLKESRSGATHELLHCTLSIENPRERWVASRSPALNIAFALAEVVWILSGSNDSHYINYWNRQLPKYAGTGDKYFGAYGYRLKKRFKINQLNRAFEVLSSSPESRQVVLQIWSAHNDLPNSNGQPKDPDIPCNLLSCLKINSNRLEWLQVIRSNDVILGVPHNFVQFTTLQEVIAGWLGVEVGSYNQVSDSLHVYERDLPKLRGLSEKVDFPKNSDFLNLPKAESDKGFREVFLRSLQLVNEELSAEKLPRIIDNWKHADSLRNLLCVLAAESARRRNLSKLATYFIEECTNHLYKILWNRWMKRVNGSNQ